jgi:hypothetical protein
MTLILIGLGSAGCSLSRPDGAFARMGDNEATSSIAGTQPAVPTPTESDLAFARNAASDVLTKGDKDSSQPWENPETGARGSVTPLAQAYSSDGRTCRDFLASCQRPVGTLVAGGRLPHRAWKVGNSYLEAMEAGLSARHPVAKMPRRPQIKPNWASSPDLNI